MLARDEPKAELQYDRLFLVLARLDVKQQIQLNRSSAESLHAFADSSCGKLA